jgi:hypothetical protein
MPREGETHYIYIKQKQTKKGKVEDVNFWAKIKVFKCLVSFHFTLFYWLNRSFSCLEQLRECELMPFLSELNFCYLNRFIPVFLQVIGPGKSSLRNGNKSYWNFQTYSSNAYPCLFVVWTSSSNLCFSEPKFMGTSPQFSLSHAQSNIPSSPQRKCHLCQKHLGPETAFRCPDPLYPLCG